MDKKAEEIRMTFCGPISGKEAWRYSPERQERPGGRSGAEGPTEDGNEGSGGAVGGSHFLQELGRHQTGPESLACVIASRGFQVEREEGMEEVVGQKG